MSISRHRWPVLLLSSSFISLVPIAPTAGPYARAAEATSAHGLRGDRDGRLWIDKSRLGEAFLLTPSALPQRGEPDPQYLRSYVVRFERHGDSLFAIESARGQSMSEDLPGTPVLAKFRVLRESARELAVDFNEGMRELPIADSFYSSDDHMAYSRASDTVAEITDTMPNEIVTEAEGITIRQIGRRTFEMNGERKSSAFEFRYFLRAYRPDPTFVPRETTDFVHSGYFEAAPVYRASTATQQTRIARWNFGPVGPTPGPGERPVTFSLSANTPADRREAIRAGILYWNQVFGREVFKVDVAPAGVTAPDLKYNVIQWFKADRLYSAQAAMSMDPLTGELLSARVILPSGWALYQNAITNWDSRYFGLTAEDATRVANDELTTVVAHEIGHNLGLRHNFAGSTAANADAETRWAAYRRYVKEGVVDPDLRVTSTVMDYSSAREDAYIGAQIRLGYLARLADYDRYAVRFAYARAGETIPVPPGLAFCTDSSAYPDSASAPVETAQMPDCRRDDEGSQAFAQAGFNQKRSLETVPKFMVERLIRAKTAVDFDPARWDPVSFLIDNRADGEEIIKTFAEQVGWLNSGKYQSVAVLAKLKPAERSFADLRDAAHRAWVLEQVRAASPQQDLADGLHRLMFSIIPYGKEPAMVSTDRWIVELETYLKRVDVLRGRGVDNRPYELTDEDVQALLSQARGIFRRIENKIAQGVIDAAATGFNHNELRPALRTALTQAVIGLVTATEKAAEGAITAKALPRYRFSKSIRLAALKLLDAPVDVEKTTWSKTAKQEVARALAEQLKTAVDASLGAGASERDVKTYPLAVRQWLNDQRPIIAALKKTE